MKRCQSFRKSLNSFKYMPKVPWSYSDVVKIWMYWFWVGWVTPWHGHYLMLVSFGRDDAHCRGTFYTRRMYLNMWTIQRNFTGHVSLWNTDAKATRVRIDEGMRDWSNYEWCTSTFDFSTQCGHVFTLVRRCKPCHLVAIIELNFHWEMIMHFIEELCRQSIESYENFLGWGECAWICNSSLEALDVGGRA